MNYFNIKFYYPSPYYHQADEAPFEIQKKWMAYPKQAAILLENFGLKSKHSYFWSDGSLYRYIETSLNRKQIQDCLVKQTYQMVEVLEVQEVLHPDQVSDLFKNNY